jgi:hypothetical protein
MNLELLVHKHPTRHLRLVFADGDVFGLKSFYRVAPSVYGKQNQWSSEVVTVIRTNGKTIKTGDGLDFFETEIAMIDLYDQGDMPNQSALRTR